MREQPSQAWNAATPQKLEVSKVLTKQLAYFKKWNLIQRTQSDLYVSHLLCVVLCQYIFAKLSPFTDCVVNYPVLHLESLIGFLMLYSVIQLFSFGKADCHKYRCNNSISLVQSIGFQPAELAVCGLAFFGCHSNSSPLSYLSKLIRWAELLSFIWRCSKGAVAWELTEFFEGLPGSRRRSRVQNFPSKWQFQLSDFKSGCGWDWGRVCMYVFVVCHDSCTLSVVVAVWKVQACHVLLPGLQQVGSSFIIVSQGHGVVI